MQYFEYCNEMERLNSLMPITSDNGEMIDLLAVLIEKWDDEHSNSEEIHPVEMLKQLMEMHELNANALSLNTGIDKTVLSRILNFKKGFSKEVIRILSVYFKVKQEAFNKPYTLTESNKQVINKVKSSL
jgi:HTH-type transcriptional regulator/antitoxin HigA